MGEYMYRYFWSGIDKGMSGWRLYIFFSFLTLAILLITIRCVFRLVELRQGYRGSLVREEVLFIVLEGVSVFSPKCLLRSSQPRLLLMALTKW